jgi:alanyl-tRNA synthetase
VTVSFHLGPSVSTIDLRGPQPSPLILEGAARAANAVIFEDREISVRYGTSEEFAGQGVRKEVDRKGILRAIEIAGIDLQPCGGTHVRRTGQIGMILIRGCTKIRQDWRVEFVCGGRAEAAARANAELIDQVSARLKCAPRDLNTSVERLLREKEVSAKRLKALIPKVADSEAAAYLGQTMPRGDGIRVISRIFESAEPDYLQHLATSLAHNENVVVLLGERETGNIVFAQNPSAAKDMNTLLKQVFAQLGGKGGGTANFARGALSAAGNSTAAIDLAKGLV